MLSNANLSKEFCGEAVHTTCYLINRCRSSTINFKTPIEMWFGMPTDYSNLKIFGCTAYIHVKDGKLDLRSKKCIFVGYPNGIKGYKF